MKWETKVMCQRLSVLAQESQLCIPLPYYMATNIKLVA